MKVQIYPMSVDLWRESPAAAAQVVEKQLADAEPDVLHVVLIGSQADAWAFIERELVGANSQLEELKVWPDVVGQDIDASIPPWDPRGRGWRTPREPSIPPLPPANRSLIDRRQ